MRLSSDATKIEQLSAKERDSMFALMQRCYDNTDRDAFEADLAAKQTVLRVFEPESGRVVGFSTQVLLETPVAGRVEKALFSGDTVVDPKSWGDNALANAWGNYSLRLMDQHEQPLSWFLTTKGFRTYRYLPLFFRHFSPNYVRPSTSYERLLTDAFGSLISPMHYDPAHGVIRSSHGKDRVQRALGAPRDRARHDPHVRFFLETNPGHSVGDELCCLAPLSRHNFTAAAMRVINAKPLTSQGA